LDFLLMLDDLERADKILRSAGYSRDFHSENVSHYIGEPPDLGRIDILHAFRAPSLGMLGRAEQIPIVHIFGLDAELLRIEGWYGKTDRD
jgi:hypothetical protein